MPLLPLLQAATDSLPSASTALQSLLTPSLAIALCAWLGKLFSARIIKALDDLGQRVSGVERKVDVIHTACFGMTGTAGMSGDVYEIRKFNHDQRTTNGRVDERLTEHGRRLDGHDEEFSSMKRRSTDR